MQTQVLSQYTSGLQKLHSFYVKVTQHGYHSQGLSRVKLDGGWLGGHKEELWRVVLGRATMNLVAHI